MEGEAGLLRGSARDSAEVLSVAFAKRSEHVAVTGNADGSCKVWDLRTQRATKRLACDKWAMPVGHALLCEDDNAIVAALGNRVVKYDLRRDEVLIKACHQGSADGCIADDINELDVHDDGRHVICADDSGTLTCLEMPLDGDELHLAFVEQAAHVSICNSVQFRPRHSVEDFVSCGFDCCVRAWDQDEQQVLSIEPFHANESLCLNPPFANSGNYSPHGDELAFAFGDGSVALAQASSPTKFECRFEAHQASACQVVLLEHQLLSVGNDRNVRLWSVQDDLLACPQLRWEFELFAKPNRVAFQSQNGSFTLACALAGSKDVLLVRSPG